jgi:hypothetical protein
MNAKSSDMWRWCSRKKNQPAPKRESHSPDACSSSACLLGKRIILTSFVCAAHFIDSAGCRVGGGPVELEAAVSVSRIWRLGVCQSSQDGQTTILTWLTLPGPSEARVHRSEDSGQCGLAYPITHVRQNAKRRKTARLERTSRPAADNFSRVAESTSSDTPGRCPVWHTTLGRRPRQCPLEASTSYGRCPAFRAGDNAEQASRSRFPSVAAAESVRSEFRFTRSLVPEETPCKIFGNIVEMLCHESQRR